MKKYLFALLAVLLMISVFGCGDSDDNSNGSEDSSDDVVEEKSLAYKFYDGIDPYKLFITFETVTDDGTNAKFAQAIDGNNITTITVYDDDSVKGLYEIFDHNTPDLIYYIDVANKKYSAENKEGTANLFAGMNKAKYETPDESGDKNLGDVEYYYESYSIGSSSTLFYFDKDTKEIYAIESVEGGESIQIMRNIKVTKDIPEDVLLGLPKDFEASGITINTDIEWPAGW